MKHKKFLLIILAVLQIPISSACSTFSDNMRNGITASESTDHQILTILKSLNTIVPDMNYQPSRFIFNRTIPPLLITAEPLQSMAHLLHVLAC